jgi:hypothetical protein
MECISRKLDPGDSLNKLTEHDGIYAESVLIFPTTADTLREGAILIWDEAEMVSQSNRQLYSAIHFVTETPKISC